ncbi:electron transfer flavoprotein subunit alpha/FixB family protein [Caballeronia sp. GAWG2-1]|uniref:electron transfer flavoprotein subunit alpha/FixB family protein n=1 Tax=Caballeronia sp. GAWG2-1 TaxID=2921744 RepID=UPI00202942F2|nr:electron transfer flavoprotein subunit alpha/FixB family protein [Caballeronia sp. GAWG2-1]
MKALVYAEHDNVSLNAATASAVAAALKMSKTVDIVICGSNCAVPAQQAARLAGVDSVVVADSPVFEHQAPESVAPLLKDLMTNYSHLVAAATSNGKGIFPRASALLDVSQVSEITGVLDSKTFERPIYAGAATMAVQSTDERVVVTVRATSFDPVQVSGSTGEIRQLEGPFSEALTKCKSVSAVSQDRVDLASAKIVVSGGRGVGSAESFRLVEALAGELHAAVGASRAAVDAGYASGDAQVGQTGKVVAPDVYIAAGISGAIQHLAGMKDSRTIVAINSDPDAPIFQIADVGYVGDLFEAVPFLTKTFSDRPA